MKFQADVQTTVYNARGIATIFNGVKRDILDLDTDSDLETAPPVMMMSSDDDVSDCDSVATYDTDWFDDRVPHGEKPPCAYVSKLTTETAAKSKHVQSDCVTAGAPSTQSSASVPCKTCNKPKWCQHYNAKHVNCRDYCYQDFLPDDPEIKHLAQAPKMPQGTDQLPTNMLNAKLFTAFPAGGEPDRSGGVADGQPGHREKEHEAGDLHHHLINWYCLVARPITRKEWPVIPAAGAAVDKEWAKLRAADNGRGTWDESAVRSLWDVKRDAKEKLATTGFHTHFGNLFDLCVEKHSELTEDMRKYKGRVVFGGHRVFDEFGLAAEFPDQGSGASFLTASKLCDAVAMPPGVQR